MIYYPNQNERTAEILSRFERQFNFAHRLFSSWWFRGERKNKAFLASPLPCEVLNLAIGLDQQAMRQFRTIVDLCEQGEAINASIIGRSLFETLLAMRFILEPRVRIPVVPVLDKNGAPKVDKWRATLPHRTIPRKNAHYLTQQFRANIYMANISFGPDKYAKRLGETKGRKRFARIVAKSVDSEEVGVAESAIGQKWTYILRHYPHTYSGLTVKDLATAFVRRQLFLLLSDN